MPFNERIVTADVVEIMDVKIVSTSALPVLGVPSGATLDVVTSGLSKLILTSAEKSALSATFTTPSATNPIVLKDDISVYYTQDDFGEILDAVQTPANLPASATVGDLIPVLSVNALYRWNGTTWTLYISTGVLDHTMLLTSTLNADPANTHISLDNLQTLEQEDHVHGFRFDPSDVNVSTSTIETNPYNYPNDTPVNFLSCGTLPTGLSAGVTYYIVNSTPSSFQVSTGVGGPPVHISSQGTNQTPTGVTGETSLPSSHLLSVMPMLGEITSAGSGKVISDFERSLLSQVSQDISKALIGTVGNPSITNKYVTDQDPRINTLRNPYVSLGVSTPPCSYPGSDVSTFNAAIKGISVFPATITAATPALITTEDFFNDGDVVTFFTRATSSEPGILPTGLYYETPYFVVNSATNNFNVSLSPGGQPVGVSDIGSGTLLVGGNNAQVKAIELLPGSYTIADSGLQWSLQNDGWLLECISSDATIACSSLTDAISILPPGAGPATIRGLTFTLSGLNTRGILVSRDNCLIEDCVFVGESPLSDGHVGITVTANYTKIKSCRFTGDLQTGIAVSGNYVSVQDCYFSVSDPSSHSVSVLSGAVGTNLLGNYFDVGTIEVDGTYTLLSLNTVTANGILVDTGSGTRFLNAPSPSMQMEGQPFYGARKTIGLPGSFADYVGANDTVFTDALADPYATEFDVLPGTYTFANSVTIPEGRSIRTSNPDGVFISYSTLPAFVMGNNTSLYGFDFKPGAATSAVTIDGVVNVTVSRCQFEASGASISNIAGGFVTVENCSFTGSTGCVVSNSSAATIDGNIFQVTGTALSTDSSSINCRIKNNTVLGGGIVLSGRQFIIRGNNFTAAVPSQFGVDDSVWQGNAPSPNADNYEGSVARIGLGNRMAPVSAGCDRVAINGFGALSFAKDATATAGTMAVPVNFAVNMAATYAVDLAWTSLATSGDVAWQVTVVFYDRITRQLGTPQTQIIASPRTKLTSKLEDKTSFVFSTYGLGVNPTNFSVLVTRIPVEPSGQTVTVANDPGGSGTAYFTTSVAHGMQSGTAIVFSTTGTLPGNVAGGTPYLVSVDSDTTFYIATSTQNLTDGIFVAYSGSGTGVQSFSAADTLPYSVQLLNVSMSLRSSI